MTDPALLAQWLAENNFEPTVGHKFQFNTKPKIKLDFDGNIYCEVLELIPCKRIVYSWKGGPGDGRITLDSIVTWTLTEKDGGTELTLVHAGFKGGFKSYISYLIMNKGWSIILKKRLPQKISNHQHETAHA